MSENPYEPPVVVAEVVGVLSGKRVDLRSVAQCQKGIIVCILIYTLILIFQFAIPVEIRPILGLGIILVGLLGTVFVFMLAIRVYGTGTGIALGLLTLFPCIGLIVLLVVNGKATSILKENGIQVGLLGAKMFEL